MSGTKQKVYVFGVDVSAEVYATSVSLDDSPSPSTFQVDLVNAHDQFSLTPDDVRLLFDPTVVEDLAEETARLPGTWSSPTSTFANPTLRLDQVRFSVVSRVLASSMPEIKRRVLLAKIQAPSLRLADIGGPENIGLQRFRELVRTQAQSNPNVLSSLAFAGIDTSPYGTGADDVILRYDFRVNSPIFHGTDAVVIYEMCPSTGRWHCVASGTPVGFTRTTTDPGRSVLRLSCEDNLRSLREASVSFNPALTDVRWISSNQAAVTQTFFTDGLYNIPWYATPFAVIFGNQIIGKGDARAAVGLSSLAAATTPAATVGRALDAQGNERPTQFFFGVNGYSKFLLPEGSEYSTGFYKFEDSRIFFYDPDAKGAAGATGAPSVAEPAPVVGAGSTSVSGQNRFSKVLTLARVSSSLGEYQLYIDSQVMLTDLLDKALFGGVVTYSSITENNLELETGTLYDSNNPNVVIDAQFLRERARRCIRLRKTSEGYAAYVDPELVVKELGENPHIYPPQIARVVSLLPIAFKADAQVTNFSLHTGPDMFTEFKSRLDVLVGLAKRVESSVHSTPKGDILVEFPLYDFRPHDYKLSLDGQAVKELREKHARLFDTAYFLEQARRMARGDEANATDAATVLPLDPVALYGLREDIYVSRFTLSEDDYHGDSLTFNGSQVVTQVQTSYYPTQDTGISTVTQYGAKPQVVSSPTLMAQYGLKLIQEDPTASLINSPQAAQAFAGLLFNRVNAEVETGALSDVFPRLGLLPNRTIVYAKGYAGARIKNLTLARSVPASYNLSIGFNNYRAWNGMSVLVDGQSVPMLTGVGSELGRPIDWRNFLAGLRPLGQKSAQVPSERATGRGGAFRSKLQLPLDNVQVLSAWFDGVFAPYAVQRPGQLQNGIKPRISSAYRKPDAPIPGQAQRVSAHNFGLALDINPDRSVVPTGPGGVSAALANSPPMLDLFAAAQVAMSDPTLQVVEATVNGRRGRYNVRPTFVLLHSGLPGGLTNWHIHIEFDVGPA